MRSERHRHAPDLVPIATDSMRLSGDIETTVFAAGTAQGLSILGVARISLGGPHLSSQRSLRARIYHYQADELQELARSLQPIRSLVPTSFACSSRRFIAGMLPCLDPLILGSYSAGTCILLQLCLQAAGTWLLLIALWADSIYLLFFTSFLFLLSLRCS